jgi:Glycosyltransferase family 87
LSGKRICLIVIQAVIIGVIIVIYLLTIKAMAQRPLDTDFYKFFMSSKFLWSGNSVYTLIPTTGADAIAKMANFYHPNLNSPFHILCMSPLGLTDFQTAFWIWSLFSLCCGLLAISLIYNTIINNEDMDIVSLITMWIIFLAYYPSWVNCLSGQFSFILLLLIVIAWRLARKGQDHEAGMVFGLAVGLKLFLGIFIILFLCYRRWRLVVYLFGTFIVCNVLSLIVFKIPTYKIFFHLLQNMPWYAGSWNASFLGFFTRIFGGSMNIPKFNLPWLARALSLIFSLSLLFWMIWYIRPSSLASGSDHFDLVFSLALTEMLLISPYGWLYYFPILILPMIVAWRFAKSHNFNSIFKICLIFIWTLTTIPSLPIWAEDQKMNQPIIWFTSAGIYFYSLLALTGILIALLYQNHKSLLRGKVI